MLHLRALRQFSVKSLFAAVTIFAIAFGHHVNGARRQREAIRVLRGAGGWVYYDFEDYDVNAVRPRMNSPLHPALIRAFGIDFFHSATVVNLEFDNYSGRHLVNSKVARDALNALRGLPRVKQLWMHGEQIDDAGLKHVGGLHDLETLSLTEAHLVTDAGIAELKRLTKLRTIRITKGEYLQIPRLGDTSLATIAALPAIEYINLDGGAFTDLGMLAFVNAKSTRHLRLLSLRGPGRNRIGDVGLSCLRDSRSLVHLALDTENVSDDGIAHLTSMKCLSLLMLGSKCGRITDGGIRHLTRLSHLEHLAIGGTTAPARSFEPLRRLGKLRFLFISPCQASIAKVKELVPQCDVH